MASILDHIGRTPLVPLQRIARGLPVPILVKCEHLNPGGSVKDRIALPSSTTPSGAACSGAGTRSSRRRHIVLADPVGSRLAQWVESGVLGPNAAYQVEGIGSSKPPEILDRKVLDSVERVSDEESFAMVKRLLREEGLWVGGSSGTAVVAALRVAARGEVREPVVALLPDGWDRYRSKPWGMQGFT